MRTSQQVLLWLSISILGALTLSPVLMGQASPGPEATAPAITDWTYHHVIFSKPATAEQARRVEQDPRYWQQIRRQSPPAPESETRPVLAPEFQFRFHRPTKNPGLWEEDLGTGATIGAGNYPAKYSLTTTTASCANDFVVFPTGLAGAAGPTTGQASIVAYGNLYTPGCTAPVPSVYWAYNTGAGEIQSSPVFSLDGTQIAFMQPDTGPGGGTFLVLLKWAASATQTIGSPDTLMSVLPGGYVGCTAPCMTEFRLTDAGTHPSDTPLPSLLTTPAMTAFVGDDSGYLHKFSHVFHGTALNLPSEVKTGGWPVQVNPSAPTALSSPVYDSVTGNVFVADNGGFLYRVNSSTAAVTTSGQLDFSDEFDGGPGIVEGPILDHTAGVVYVFATSDGSEELQRRGRLHRGLPARHRFCYWRYWIGGRGWKQQHRNYGAESNLHWAFDSTYKNSANATGNLYVCGNTGGTPTIYQVAIADGVPGTVNAGPVLSTSTTPCSPVTDVLNSNASGGATEWIFASAEAGGVSTACASGGCLLNFKDTPWLALNAYTVGQEVVDSNFHIEFVGTAGRSSAGPVFWNSSPGGSTTDGTVGWLDLGPVSAAPLASWVHNHPYSRKGAEILDGNNNIELVTTTGTSGASVTFNLTVGGTTTDGTVTWTNVGPPPTAALAVTGGTSGIIVDNTVATGTEAGASQVYFSILGSQTCTTSGGTGGCAVQASQSALK